MFYKKLTTLMQILLLASSMPCLALPTPLITQVPGSPFAAPESGCIAYAPNGSWCAVAGLYGTLVTIFSVAANGVLQEIQSLNLPNFYILTGITFSPDSNFIAVQGEDGGQTEGAVQIIRVDQRTGLLTPLGDSRLVGRQSQGGILYSSDQKALLVANYNNGSNCSITSFQVNADGSLGDFFTVGIDTLFAAQPLRQIALSPNNSYIAAATNTLEGQATLLLLPFDSATGSITGTTREYPVQTTNLLSSLAFSPDGNFLVLVDAVTTLLVADFNQATGSIAGSTITLLPDSTANLYQTIAFSPDGQYIGISQYDFQLVLLAFDSLQGQANVITTTPFPLPVGNSPIDIAFSPITKDGFSFLSTANEYSTNISSYALKLGNPAAISITSPAATQELHEGSVITGTCAPGNTVTVAVHKALLPVIVHGATWSATINFVVDSPLLVVATARGIAGTTATATREYPFTLTPDEQEFSQDLFHAIATKYYENL